MEDKLVRVAKGSIFDVAVDIRPESTTFGQWFATELTDENQRSLYIPKGFAHGFLTLVDDTTVVYQIAQPYVPNLARGLNWDDSQIAIRWPHPPAVMSARDRALPNLSAIDLTST
jgi:dTDP-4-dehydrorhamnose 3,5-epimerase